MPLVIPRDLEQPFLAHVTMRLRSRVKRAPHPYRLDPVAYAYDRFKVKLWGKQREIAQRVAQPNSRTAVAACHASGKSFVAAVMAMWFLDTQADERGDPIVLTTAPTWRQVNEVLWREMRGLYIRARPVMRGTFQRRSARWEIGPQWFALGLSTNEPERFQGFHAPKILVIEDEASGIPDAIDEAVEGVMSTGDARLLKIGNPTRIDGHFHSAFTHNRAHYNLFHISAYDTPAFTAEEGGYSAFPMLISPEWVAEKQRSWGEDSDIYRVRVLGSFPRYASENIIHLEWVERAYYRDQAKARTGPLELGVDVARQGRDRSVIVVREGPVVMQAAIVHGYDTVQLSRLIETTLLQAVKQWQEQRPLPNFDSHGSTAKGNAQPPKPLNPKAVSIKIDDAGVGGGLTDQLRHKGYRVVPINGASAPLDSTHYPNMRCELWYEFAGMLKDGMIDLSRLDPATFDNLTSELVTPKGSIDSRNRRKVEPKEDIVARLGFSPDIADALILAYAPATVSKAGAWKF